MSPDITSRIKDLTRPTGTEDLLNVNYPRPRVRIEPRHAVILAAVVVALLGVWFVSRPDPPPEAFPLAEVQETLVSDVHETPTEIVVSVVGHVDKPGLVTLAPGARIAEAVEHAEPRPDAQLTAVNLAEVVADGVQVHIPGPGEEVSEQPGGVDAVAGLVSLNTASVAELVTLPGVGEKTAAAIIAHREQHGGFKSVDQLAEVKGIGPAKFAEISPLVSV